MKLWSFFQEYEEKTNPDGSIHKYGGNLQIKIDSSLMAIITVSNFNLATVISNKLNIDITPSEFLSSIKKETLKRDDPNKCLIFNINSLEEFEKYSSNPTDTEYLRTFLFFSWFDDNLIITKFK